MSQSKDGFHPLMHRALGWITRKEPRYLNPLKGLVIIIVGILALIVRFFYFLRELIFRR